MDKLSRFGRQPVADILKAQGRTLAGTARHLGLNVSHVVSVTNGRVAPPDEVKQAFTDLLGIPVEDLFTPDALAATYHRRKNSLVGRGEGAPNE